MCDNDLQNAKRKDGDYLGRHFSSYVEEVKDLKRKGDDSNAEKLLYKLIKATENEDAISKHGVAPWYYEQLAILYRKTKDYKSEVSILTRYSNHQQNRRPFTKTPLLLKRLTRAKKLLAKVIENEIDSRNNKKICN